MWISKYKENLGVRYSSFELLFQTAEKRELKNIVETGTARGKKKFYYLIPRMNWKDGMSTILFAEYSKTAQGEFWSCDIDYKNINNAYEFLAKLNYKANFVIADSTEFLKNFGMQIDILYLDSLDGDIDGAADHQLKEVQYAIDKMNNNGLIFLDDKGKKTNLSIPFLLNKGWKVMYETNQQILISK